MIECPADAVRGWRNESTEELRVLVIKHTGGAA